MREREEDRSLHCLSHIKESGPSLKEAAHKAICFQSLRYAELYDHPGREREREREMEEICKHKEWGKQVQRLGSERRH